MQFVSFLKKYHRSLLKEHRPLVQGLHILAFDMLFRAEWYEAGLLVLLAALLIERFEEIL